jgi:hypothetical protein
MGKLEGHPMLKTFSIASWMLPVAIITFAFCAGYASAQTAAEEVWDIFTSSCTRDPDGRLCFACKFAGRDDCMTVQSNVDIGQQQCLNTVPEYERRVNEFKAKIESQREPLEAIDKFFRIFQESGQNCADHAEDIKSFQSRVQTLTADTDLSTFKAVGTCMAQLRSKLEARKILYMGSDGLLKQLVDLDSQRIIMIEIEESAKLLKHSLENKTERLRQFSQICLN